MTKKWRAAVVGTGVVGSSHLAVLSAMEETELVAACDIVPSKCQQAFERYKLPGVPVYGDINDMLRKEKLDLVTICTPSGNHRGPAETALNARKYVITEKPMEIQVDRIDAMGETAKRNGVRIAGIFQNRWNPANIAIQQATREGRFGRVAWAGSFTPWYRADKYYQEVDWRGTWALDGGGAVMNQSVHNIDLLQWIAGPVKRVSAYASSRIHPTIETEDTLSASLEFESGAFGTVLGTTAMYPGMPARIEIGGENGTAISENGLKTFAFRESRAADQELLERLAPPPPASITQRIKEHGGDELYQAIFNRRSGVTVGGASNAADIPQALHRDNIRDILQSWDAGRDADTCPSEARKAVAIINAMYESVRKNGAAVDVK